MLMWLRNNDSAGHRLRGNCSNLVRQRVTPSSAGCDGVCISRSNILGVGPLDQKLVKMRDYHAQISKNVIKSVFADANVPVYSSAVYQIAFYLPLPLIHLLLHF